MKRFSSTTLVSVVFAATIASTAIAQTAPNADASSTSKPAHRFMEGPFSRPTERVEARLAYVKTALKITDGQQSQWDAYANVVRKHAQDMEQRFQSKHHGESGHARHQRPTAIERLERSQSFLAETVTRVNQLLSVEKPLYVALSVEQQKVADVVLNPRFRPMGGHSVHGHSGSGRG